MFLNIYSKVQDFEILDCLHHSALKSTVLKALTNGYWMCGVNFIAKLSILCILLDVLAEFGLWSDADDTVLFGLFKPIEFQ